MKKTFLPQGGRRHAHILWGIFSAWVLWRKEDHKGAMKALWTRMGGAKGLFLKIGQWISLVPGLFPQEYVRIFQTLQSKAPPMMWPLVRRRMEMELGPHWMARFRCFERQASYAASLSQVHRGQLLDGTVVACKIQYPSMESALHQDLAFLRWLCGMCQKWYPQVDTQSFMEELSEHVLQETDFSREAHHLLCFQKIFHHENAIHVPRPFPQLSTKKILLMTWEDGHIFQHITEAPASLRNEFGKNLFRAWYKPFYTAAMLHGDAHWGNFLWRPQGHVVMLDFGCLRIFDPSFVGRVVRLFSAMCRGKDQEVMGIYEEWFQGAVNNTILSLLHQWVCFLMRPFLTNEEAVFGQNNSVYEGKTLLWSIYQKLRHHGIVRIPREFWLLDRVSVAIGAALMHTGAHHNWYKLLHEMQEEFSEEQCSAYQGRLLRGGF